MDLSRMGRELTWRARRSQCRGQGFEPLDLHHIQIEITAELPLRSDFFKNQANSFEKKWLFEFFPQLPLWKAWAC